MIISLSTTDFVYSFVLRPSFFSHWVFLARFLMRHIFSSQMTDTLVQCFGVYIYPMHEELKTSISYFFLRLEFFPKGFFRAKVLTRRMFDGLSEDTRHRSDSVILCKLRHPRGSVVTHNLCVLSVIFNTIMIDFMQELIGHVTPKLSLCLGSTFPLYKGVEASPLHTVLICQYISSLHSCLFSISNK